MAVENVTVTVTATNLRGASTTADVVLTANIGTPDPPPGPPSEGVWIGASHANDAGTNSNGVVYNRLCGSGYTIECYRSQVRTDIPDATFEGGVNRRFYWSDGTAFPTNADTTAGRINRDYAAGRMAMTSQKFGSGTFNLPTGNYDSNIHRMGGQIAAWQATHPYDFLYSYWHEPNNGEPGTPAAYRDSYEYLVDIFDSEGVQRWEGSLEGVTTTPGIMYCGPVLSGGAFAWPSTIWNDWWPASWTWGNNNLVASGVDGYNRGPQWHSFRGVMGGHPSRQGYKSWSDAKRTAQHNAGNPHFQTIWEVGCRERGVRYTTFDTTDWLATGYTANQATKPNWFEDMRDYISTSWDYLFALAYFDSGQGAEGPWNIDSTQASWDKWVEIVQDPVFRQGPF